MGQTGIRRAGFRQHPSTRKWSAFIAVGDGVVQSGWTAKSNAAPWALANELARRLEVTEAQLANQTTIANALLGSDAQAPGE